MENKKEQIEFKQLDSKNETHVALILGIFMAAQQKKKPVK